MKDPNTEKKYTCWKCKSACYKLRCFICNPEKENCSLEKIYGFPLWVTDDMKKWFFNMWWVFGRWIDDYNKNRLSNRFPKNWTKIYLRSEKTWEEREAEYFFKRNNIARAFDGLNVYNISTWWTLFGTKQDLRDAKDFELMFLITDFK